MDQEYRIGQVALDKIVQLAGTPVYVYDSAIMARQVTRLHKAFTSVPLRIMYACKANANINVLI
ncbi:MAG: hypothetical protein IPG74_05930 [Flavobacteriales bacterium]|nr:hypothetical protein [Flavobacteriales bacterium]